MSNPSDSWNVASRAPAAGPDATDAKPWRSAFIRERALPSWVDVADAVSRVEFVPAAVQVFCAQAELDDQYGRKVGRSRLPALLFPESQKGFLVFAHDDPGVGAADEVTSIYQAGHFSVYILLISKHIYYMPTAVNGEYMKLKKFYVLVTVQG